MKLLVAVLVGAALFMGSCGVQGQKVGEMQRESRSIQPKNAKPVRAHLMMRALLATYAPVVGLLTPL
jgi:hypothetical protein